MSDVLEITQCIERLEALEERAGVSLEALYAAFEQNDYGNRLVVNFDVLAVQNKIKNDVTVVVGAYNAQGQLLATDDARIYSDEFYGIDSKSVSMDCPEPPARIRVYCKKG